MVFTESQPLYNRMPKPVIADNGTFLKAAKIKFVKTARCFILKSNKVR